MKISNIRGIELLELTLIKAIDKHPESPTLHHAMSVLREETIELETEAYRQEINSENLRKEALHVAVTALRIVIEHT